MIAPRERHLYIFPTKVSGVLHLEKYILRRPRKHMMTQSLVLAGELIPSWSQSVSKLNIAVHRISEPEVTNWH